MLSGGAADTASRRARTPCKFCGIPIDLARLREHLRGEHRADSTQVEALYLSARIEARKSQRAR
ncbi:MAG: hypothetical protein WBG19_09825 [Thermoplasmata archaeon]